MKALYREALDHSRCEVPGCTDSVHDGWIYLHGRCHPTSRVAAKYMDGVVAIECAECSALIVALNVASEWPGPRTR